MLIARVVRLPVDGFLFLCNLVHKFSNIIFVAIILGFIVSVVAGLALMTQGAFGQTMLAHALQNPAYVVSALAVLAVLIIMERIGAQQDSSVAAPVTRAMAPIDIFDMPKDARPVGRQALLEAIRRRLRAGLSANVHGMPGVGKSYVAAAVVTGLLGPGARKGRRLFPGGVVWINCDTLQGGEAGLQQLVAKVSIALGITLMGGGGPAEQLTRALQARQRTLIVLDGLELSEGRLREAEVMRALRLPGTTVLLLTTRERIEADLGPDGTRQADDGKFALAPLPEAEAVAMYSKVLGSADRARSIALGRKPGRTRPNDSERQQIAALVRRLGCLPLAVELNANYAGRTGLDLASVQAELERDGIPAESLSARDAERAVLACFGRALRVLPDPQRQLFAALTLLGGSFPRGAALTLARAISARTTGELGGLAEVVAPAERDLGVLVDTSLLTDLDVRPITHAEAPVPEPRYALHPLLREYAARIWNGQLLVGGEEVFGGQRTEMAMDAGNANLGYWATFVQSEADPIRLVREDENLAAAAAWAEAHNQLGATAGFVALGLARARAHTGRVADAKAQYARVIELARHLDDENGKRLAREAYHYRGLLLYTEAPSEEVRSDLEQALRLGWELGDIAAQAEDLINLAQIDIRQADQAQRATGARQTVLLAQARERLRESEQLTSQIADDNTRQRTRRDLMHFLGRVDEAEGDFPSALAHYAEALSLSEAEHNVFSTAQNQRHLGYVTALTGDTRRGLRLIRDGLATYEANKDLYASGLCYKALGEVYEQRRRKKQACENYEHALKLFTEHGAASRVREVEEALRRNNCAGASAVQGANLV